MKKQRSAAEGKANGLRDNVRCRVLLYVRPYRYEVAFPL